MNLRNEFLLEVDGLSAKTANHFLLKEISFTIMKGECWGFSGPTGSGKSSLLRCIKNYSSYCQSIHFENNRNPKISLIGHQNQFKNLSGGNDFYYQQRFNASDAEDATTVGNVLKSISSSEDLDQIVGLLHLEEKLYQPVIQLSNGEHKRFQIAKALLEKSDWILLDSPYVGLDVNSRRVLDEILVQLIQKEIHLMLVSENEFPAFITHVATLEDGTLTGIHTRKEFKNLITAFNKEEDGEFQLKSFPQSYHYKDFENAVEMRNVNVKYHDKSILKDINWTVIKGSRWSVSGPNGSGKSTLLSLITADNPQAFANEIYLFDHKKGNGESIWEIKRKIGFVSPELHHYFDKSINCFDVVASGLFDTIGLFRKLSADQQKTVKKILEIFKISAFEAKPLGTLSQGQQRVVLLARAMVKNPPLLILDEPCQGLDDSLAKKFIEIVDVISTVLKKTLIYVTHEESKIPRCVDHYIKLEKGRIIENNQKNEKENHRHSRRRYRA